MMLNDKSFATTFWQWFSSHLWHLAQLQSFVCIVVSIHRYDWYKWESEYLVKVETHVIILLGGNRSKMCCTIRTTEEITGSGVPLFLKCCSTTERASLTDMSGLLQFEIPGSKITTYIYCTAFQWILVNTVGLPEKMQEKHVPISVLGCH